MSPSHRAPLGSSKSTKAMEQSVIHGQKVRLRELGTEGYLYGADDFHWLLVNPTTLSTMLVHKSQAVVEILREDTYSSEPKRAEMEPLVAPYREHILQAQSKRGASS